MTIVAVIDDDPSVRELASAALTDEETTVLTAASADGGLRLAIEKTPDVVLLDIHLPDRSGLDVFGEIREVDRRMPVVFITGDDTGESVIEALKLGAYDYIAKPLDVANLRAVVKRAADARRRMSIEVALPAEGSWEASTGADAMLGRSRGMIEVYRAVAQCARQDVPVLVRGESGTGKELIARAIYQHGLRSNETFLAVNCATLQESLLESELFGHEKGAFTGAASRRIGKFEQCDGGTIFLDEVGDMPPPVQAKILRLLQKQEFQRLGGSENINTDVRIISATNRPLEEMCETGAFRLDLYHRLNGYEITVPPLRDRGGDVLTLIEYFVSRFQSELRLDGFEGITPDALNLLVRYDWPGNVRELEATMRQCLMDMRGPVLIPEFLPATLNAPPTSVKTTADTPGLDALILSGLDSSKNLYGEVIETVERRLLELVLAKTSGNQSRAAEILGITRGKLRNRIREFELDLDSLDAGGR